MSRRKGGNGQAGVVWCAHHGRRRGNKPPV